MKLSIGLKSKAVWKCRLPKRKLRATRRISRPSVRPRAAVRREPIAQARTITDSSGRPNTRRSPVSTHLSILLPTGRRWPPRTSGLFSERRMHAVSSRRWVSRCSPSRRLIPMCRLQSKPFRPGPGWRRRRSVIGWTISTARRWLKSCPEQ